MRKKKMIQTAGTCAAAMTPAVMQAGESASSAMPNIVYVLCDDLGYGDVQCMNPERGKIPTPHADRLATQGMIFTDAHGGSSVCTPTRYGLLTGRYAWRSSLQKGVLLGYSGPIIAKDRLTVPGLLKQHGYHTACIGKWHLGMKIAESSEALEVQDGPVTRGFDYYFGISGSLDMPPYAFIENDRLTAATTATKQWEMTRSGLAAPDFEPVDVLPALEKRATEYIAERAAAKKPFFLYLSLSSPHTPLVPTDEWKGKSGLGDYGDFVMQTDHVLGEVMNALDQAGIAGNTLLIFTSDNGFWTKIPVEPLIRKGHYPSAHMRGYKMEIWDGGHRIPFIARWPGTVPAGSRSDQLVCLTDLMATCADLLGAELPDSAGEDSVSILPLLRGGNDPVRTEAVHHSMEGKFAVRDGHWKLAICPGSGTRFSDPDAAKKGLSPVQLYNLQDDPGETKNVAEDHPEQVRKMVARLKQMIDDGRSTPGPKQKNDVPVDLWKLDTMPEMDAARIEKYQ